MRPAFFSRWLEPELFQPLLFGVLIALTCSEFIRGALLFTLIPTYGKTVLGFAVEWTALALSIHYFVDNLLRSPAGWLIDHFGQRTILLTGFSLSGISVFWMIHAHSILGLILSLGLFGLGVTPMWPAAMATIGQTTTAQKRATLMGYMYIFWLLGTGLGPVLINFAILYSYLFSFWLLIGIATLGFFLTFKLVHVRQPRAEMKQMQAIASHAKNATNWWALFAKVRKVAFLFPGMFAQTFAVASLIPILSVYAKVVLHVSGPMYSAILTSGGVITILLLLPAGKLVDQYSPRPFLVGAFLLAGVALVIYPFFHTLLATYGVVLIFGLCYAFILPAWNSVLDHCIDSEQRATLWGVFMTVEGLGSAVGPYLGGLFWDIWSPNAPFWVSGTVILMMGILYTRLPIVRAHRKSQLAGTYKNW